MNNEFEKINGFCYLCNKRTTIITENEIKVCLNCKDTFIMESDEDYNSSDFIPVRSNIINNNITENNLINTFNNTSSNSFNNNFTSNVFSNFNINSDNYNNQNSNNTIISSPNNVNNLNILNHFTNRTFRIFNNIMNNDTIRTLMSQINQGSSTSRPPASKEEIENLDSLTISESNVKNFNDLECLICKENYIVGDVVCKIRCGHYNHKDCLIMWLNKQNNCPICRYELKTDDPIYENNKNRS